MLLSVGSACAFNVALERIPKIRKSWHDLKEPGKLRNFIRVSHAMTKSLILVHCQITCGFIVFNNPCSDLRRD